MIIGDKDWFPKLQIQLTTHYGGLQKADFMRPTINMLPASPSLVSPVTIPKISFYNEGQAILGSVTCIVYKVNVRQLRPTDGI